MQAALLTRLGKAGNVFELPPAPFSAGQPIGEAHFLVSGFSWRRVSGIAVLPGLTF